MYVQEDLIMDWKTGTFYRVRTLGLFGAGGTPNGLAVEGYGGTTTIHGIPLYGEEDLTEYLMGKNIDGVISVGADALGKISGTKGVSVDLDEDFHPVQTNAGLLGYQYTIENSIEVGANAVPNEIDISFEGGMSESWIKYKYVIPWWPW